MKNFFYRALVHYGILILIPSLFALGRSITVPGWHDGFNTLFYIHRSSATLHFCFGCFGV